MGKVRRMQRLFDRQGRSLIVAVDHAAFGAPGPEDPQAMIATVVQAGADAVLASWEIAQTCAAALGRAGLILRLDGGTSLETARLQHTVEDALRLGADAVCAMVGAWSDQQAIRVLGQACLHWGMPLMLEFPLEEAAASTVASVAEAAVSAGADLLKLPFVQPALFADIVHRCAVPIVILGGGRVPEDTLLKRVAASRKAGGAGVAVGRNVWQHPDPGSMVRTLAALIREPSSKRRR